MNDSLNSSLGVHALRAVQFVFRTKALISPTHNGHLIGSSLLQVWAEWFTGVQKGGDRVVLKDSWRNLTENMFRRQEKHNDTCFTVRFDALSIKAVVLSFLEGIPVFSAMSLMCIPFKNW